MNYLHKLSLVFLSICFFISANVKGQKTTDGDIIEEYLNDSTMILDDLDDIGGLSYEYFLDIDEFDDWHLYGCEDPNIEVNIEYYQKLFDVRFPFEKDEDCKQCQSEALAKIIKETLKRKTSLNEIRKKLSQQDLIKLVRSDDNKLFSIQWNLGGLGQAYYILVHQVVDGIYHIQNDRLYYQNDFDDYERASLIDKIERIKNTDRYIIFRADADAETVYLFGVGLSDNIMNREYMFGDNAFYFEILLGDMFPQRKELINLDGIQLSYLYVSNEGDLEKQNLFYNGFCFKDIVAYNRDFSANRESGSSRKYYVISKSSDWANKLHSRLGMDMVVDMCKDYSPRAQKEDEVYDLMLYQGIHFNDIAGVDSVIVHLPIRGNRASLDGVTSVWISEQLESHYDPNKTTGSQPIYVAGHDEAFSYEKVRYTAVLFDKKPSIEETQQVTWAVEVDGKINYLDKYTYRGMQICLDMNPAWTGKVIKVIPYIGKIVDQHFYCETEVLSRY